MAKNSPKWPKTVKKSSCSSNLALKFVAMENSSKPWNRAEEFSEFEEQQGCKNDAMLMKEGR